MEEDKFYAFGLFKYTYGYWDLMKNDLKNSEYFMFNWVVQTRTIAEIQKRSDYLISLFKLELSAKPAKKAAIKGKNKRVIKEKEKDKSK